MNVLNALNALVVVSVFVAVVGGVSGMLVKFVRDVQNTVDVPSHRPLFWLTPIEQPVMTFSTYEEWDAALEAEDEKRKAAQAARAAEFKANHDVRSPEYLRLSGLVDASFARSNLIITAGWADRRRRHVQFSRN